MKIRERFQAAVQAFRGGEVEKLTTGGTQAWATIFAAGLDTLPGFSAGRLTQPYAQHPTVYAAVSAIATNLAALPLEFFPESDDERETPDQQAKPKKLIERPNPLMAGNQLIEQTLIYLELYGNAFWFKDQEARRTGSDTPYPRVLECWDPCKVRPIMNGDKLTGWEYRTQNTTITTGVDRVLHFKYPNPYDMVWGLAPLEAAMIVAGADYQAGVWNRAFFDNFAMPTGVLTPKTNQMIDKDAMTRIRDQMEARHGGAARHGKLGAVNIPMEFLEIGTSQKDMDFSTMLDKATEKLLMVWKVPPVVAGVLKDANYNVAIQQAKQFWHNHMPKLHYMESVIYYGLCEPYAIPLRPWFKTEMVRALTEDMESVSNTVRNLWNMGVPFEMLNERYELGFDVGENVSLETSWLPFSMVNADEQAMAPPMAAVGGPSRGPTEGDTPAQPGDESTVADDPTEGKALATPTGREFQRSLSWRTLIGKVRDDEEAYRKRLRDHFWTLRSEMVGKLRTGKTIKAPEDINVDVMMFDEDRAADDLKMKVKPLYKSAVQKGAEAIIAELHLEIDFNILSPAVQKFLAEKMFEIVDLVDGPVADRLRITLQEGIAKGESIDKLTDRVVEVFDVQRFRAERIARTEVAEAFNAGRFATMKDAGVTRIEWLSARDNRVRETHRDLDGDVVVLGDKFKNGLLYPLDKNGPPEEIVNCRCVIVPAA